MDFFKKLWNDILGRIFANPKSSVAGVIAMITYLTALYGFEVPTEILALISSALLTLLGLLIKDK